MASRASRKITPSSSKYRVPAAPLAGPLKSLALDSEHALCSPYVKWLTMRRTGAAKRLIKTSTKRLLYRFESIALRRSGYHDVNLTAPTSAAIVTKIPTRGGTSGH